MIVIITSLICKSTSNHIYKYKKRILFCFFTHSINNNLNLKKHINRFPRLFRLFQCLYSINNDNIVNENTNEPSICLLNGCISLNLKKRKKGKDDIYIVFHFLDSKYHINKRNKNNQVISVGETITNYNLSIFNVNCDFKYAIFRIIENKVLVFFTPSNSENISLGGFINIFYVKSNQY